jgi:hypothetical protein
MGARSVVSRFLKQEPMMNFKSWRQWLWLGVGFVMLIARPVWSQDTQLQALNCYEGVWNSDFSIVPTDGSPATQTFSGVVTGKWVVGDKFLEQTGKYDLAESSPPLVIKTMMSFDQKRDRYQYDYYTSSGDIRRSYGQWDPDAKKMTSKMTDPVSGNVSTIVADFSKPEVESWVIETKNSAGAVLTKIVGTNKRKKSKQP